MGRNCKSHFQLRTARPSDAEAITKVYVDSWNSGFGSRMPVIRNDAARISRRRKSLEDVVGHTWWVAEDNKDIIGFLGIGPSRDPIDPEIGEVDTIAVAPSHWHQGVGRLLMGQALEVLRADGYKNAILWTLNEYPLGERFYTSTGWVKSGTTRSNGDQVQYKYDISSL